MGFSDEVQLGEMGAISEIAEEIMEVYIEDTLTHQRLELADDPLFRGKVLTTYANRKWKQSLFHGKSLQPPRLPPEERRPCDNDLSYNRSIPTCFSASPRSTPPPSATTSCCRTTANKYR